MRFRDATVVFLTFATALCAPGSEADQGGDAAPVDMPDSSSPTNDVRPGIEVLLSDSLTLVRGRRVGLITNHTGRDRAGTPSIDLLAAHPEWTTQELRSAILDLAEKPASDMVAYVSTGTLRDPTGTRRGACEAEPSTVAEVPLGAWTAEQLYPDGEAPAHAHTVALDVLFVSGAGWRVREILRAVRRAAGILAQCEVAVNRVRLRMIETPRRYRYLHDAWSRRLVQRLDPSRPAVFFVEGTLRRPAFEAEAFGQANTRRTPWMRDTVWITRAAEPAGVVLAHELFHVLADLGRHETDPGNLMNERVGSGNTRLRDWQCERLRKVATAFGLAVPAR